MFSFAGLVIRLVLLLVRLLSPDDSALTQHLAAQVHICPRLLMLMFLLLLLCLLLLRLVVGHCRSYGPQLVAGYVAGDVAV